MRERSSRLFIVLLHLVGVSTNLPRRHGSHLGIVGVNPFAILLERLELQEFDDGLDGLLRSAGQGEDDLLLVEPYWLQDDVDGTCLGPAGFSECGDATLWHVRRRPPFKRRYFGLFPRQEKDWGYALQLVDDDFSSAAVETTTGNGDCLSRKKGELKLDRCARDTAWSWRVSAEGILFHGGKKLHPSQCLWRNASSPILSSCEDDEEDSSHRLVRFSMVRYHHHHHHHTSAAVSTPVETARPVKSLETEQQQDEHKVQAPSFAAHERRHVNTVDKAHSHASEPLLHPDLKSSSQLLFAPLRDFSKPQLHPRNLLKAASPILMGLSEKDLPPPPPPPSLHEKRSSSSPVKLRKMPTHPYIAAAKNEVWTDPQTGLEYHTDLCGYLGHDRRESGRHTLTGVGQYTRTVFNIKVYGVAFYVSKRDVLADPLFESFASLSKEELRDRPDFYSHLRHMPSPLDDRGGIFDRTLMLKLNMQLSTDTMRSSLQADWKMLTEERKNLLINSSMKPRPADENMLKKIQSEENPGNCSCGQEAPEEYRADASCCARGTELVFTWRKNGDVELRLDGRIMDIFPRPDIAEGIFYEYLRYDDPISPDFINTLVDGFPFLLAPLAQVKGVSMPSSMSDDRHEERGFVKTVGGIADMFFSQTEHLGSWLHDSASVMASRASSAVQSAGDTARGIGEEMDRSRKVFWRQMSSLPESSFHYMASRIQPHKRAALSTLPSWMRDMGGKPDLEFEEEDNDKPRTPGAPRGRVFRSPLTQWLGESHEAPLPDEIGPMIHPTVTFTRKVCLAMVHLYLLLLLIVSLPGSPNTRTKLVVRRKPRAGDDPSRDSSSMAKGAKLQRIGKNSDECSKGNMKKSLSYYV